MKKALGCSTVTWMIQICKVTQEANALEREVWVPPGSREIKVQVSQSGQSLTLTMCQKREPSTLEEICMSSSLIGKAVWRWHMEVIGNRF